MRHALFISAIAAALGANAHTRDSYFGFGVGLPVHSSAKLADWHDSSSARVGARVVVGTHLNKWFTLEGEAYQSRIKISGASAHDKTGALSVGVLANAIVRKELKSGSVYAGIGFGIARNKTYDYERALLTNPISFDTSLLGRAQNKYAAQFKIGIVQDLTKRLSVSAELTHLLCGSFSYLDTSVTSQLVRFKGSITSINTSIRFRF